jgi:hypothetical protein
MLKLLHYSCRGRHDDVESKQGKSYRQVQSGGIVLRRPMEDSAGGSVPLP